jgi:hypothetical protein
MESPILDSPQDCGMMRYRIAAVEKERGKAAIELWKARKAASTLEDSAEAFATYQAWVWAHDAVVFQYNALFPVQDYPPVPTIEECERERWRAWALHNEHEQWIAAAEQEQDNFDAQQIEGGDA